MFPDFKVRNKINKELDKLIEDMTLLKILEVYDTEKLDCHEYEQAVGEMQSEVISQLKSTLATKYE